MSILHLARHASHDRVSTILCGRMAGVGLGEQGLREAAALARRLSAESLDAVLSSPRDRAVETARIVAEALDRPMHIVPDLDEVDFGDWTGRSFAELDADPRWRQWNERRSEARVPGGESMVEVQERIAGVIERLCGAAGGTCLLVSHAEPIRAALLGVLGLPLDAYGRLSVDPASLSSVELWPGGSRVLRLNEVPMVGEDAAR